VAAAVLKEIESRLRGMFSDGVLVDVSFGNAAETYTANAAAASDPVLRDGYLQLAEEAGA
jgi:hypothetical protein